MQGGQEINLLAQFEQNAKELAGTGGHGVDLPK